MTWTPNEPIPNQKAKNSPALAEFAGALHMVHPGDESNDIWHSSSLDGLSWTPNERILDQKSKGPSALAMFDDRLHLVHQGDEDNQLWHSSFDGERWTTNAKITGESAQSAPALASFGGVLHLVHNGNSSTKLFHLTFNGQTWTKRPDDPALLDQRSKGSVALAVSNGLLHMVHQGDTSNDLWHSTFDGIGWTANVKIDNQQSKSPPALAALGNLLHLVHLGDTANAIWHSTFDDSGPGWAPNIEIPHQLASSAPALAAHGNRLHMVHTGDSETTIWRSDSDGVLINRPTRRVVVIDIDGVRWDSFYRHLKRVTEAGASTTATYEFALPPGASDDTLLDDGGQDLHSALAELCFADGSGMVDVRLALTSYPSFTFPTHATMYSGTWPGHHGIAGHKFVVRDAPPEWDWHQWDALPRALALQGYCTDEEGSWGAFWDYLWGGFDQVSADDCRNRNRGLTSDLRVPTMFRSAELAGKRTCAIHAFYHGADKPWEHYGKDQWWHYDAVELRSIKDICSDEDIDQLEVADHGTFAKAEVLLRAMPSTVRVTPPNTMLYPGVGGAFNKLDGDPRSGWSVEGDPHPDGPPDLIALYMASVDEASHQEGPRNQETYLAWFDHRLARFVRQLRAADPDVFENTIFAFVADHGHAAISNPPSTSGLNSDNVVLVREELVRIQHGEAERARLRKIADAYYVGYSSLLQKATADQTIAWAEAMNLYVYVRDPATFPVVEVATRLLSMPMNTEPYGALVLIDGVYQFLARGEVRPVPLDSASARGVVVPRLDPPPVSTTEIDAVSIAGDDATRERMLREALNTPQVFDLLGVGRRVAGFAPIGNRSTPDIILLAPEGRSFTSSPSTHGSFAYPTSRIPMVFCGPGMPAGRVTLETADLVDFAPTIMSLLGLPSDGMDGRALVDFEGKVPSIILRRPTPEVPVLTPRTISTVRDKTALPEARVLLTAGKGRQAKAGERASDAPAYVALKVVERKRRTPRAAGPARQITAEKARWVQVEKARIEATPGAKLWVEKAGTRRKLGRKHALSLPAHGPMLVGSSASREPIEVSSECLVVPVTITLPQIPEWLHELLGDLRRHTRIALKAPWATDRTLLSSHDFIAAVGGLRSQLDPSESVERALETPPVLEAEPPHAAVQRAVADLEALLKARKVSRFTLGSPQGFVG